MPKSAFTPRHRGCGFFRLSGIAAIASLAAIGTASAATSFYVSTSGNDANPGSAAAPWRTIQKAASSALPGSTVFINAGTYYEKVNVRVSGNASAGFITFRNNGTDHVVVDGTGVSGAFMFFLSGNNYIRIQGLEICNDIGVSDGSGIRIDGGGDHCEFRNNVIHDIRGQDAMGITIYGTDAAHAITNLVIDGNTIYNCQPAHSETLTLNGNVNGFQVTNNIVHDVNNIGIDFIGGEGTCPTASLDVTRNGVCRGNTVYHARSTYAECGGIYVDGAQNITIEANVCYQNNYGIEIGAENAGVVASGIVVRNNLLYGNDSAGLIFGGYQASAGRVNGCSFLGNTLYGNDTRNDGTGDLYLSNGTGNTVQGNIIFSTQSVVFYAESGATGNKFDYNLYFGPSANAEFDWAGRSVSGFAALKAASGQDTHSVWASPQFVNAAGGDFHLLAASPAINAGNPAYVPGMGETDVFGGPRIVGGRIDIGASEYGSTPTATPTATPSPAPSTTPGPSPTPTSTPTPTPAPTASPSPGTLVRNPVADAYVRDGSYANTNFGTAASLVSRSTSTLGYNRISYLTFDISALKTVTNATLELTTHLNTTGLVTTEVYTVPATGWQEANVTWNTRPAVGQLVGSFNVGQTTAQTYRVNVTNYIQSQIALGHSVVSFALRNPAGSGLASVTGSRESATPPKLVITGN